MSTSEGEKPTKVPVEKPEELAQIVKSETNNHRSLMGSSKGKDIVVVLGNTGCGKSTTLNWLADDVELKGLSNGDIVLSGKPNDKALPIGVNSKSTTKYPRSIEIDGRLFFDLPGFRDTGGAASDLVNAAFIRDILVEANSVVVIFVVGQDEVTAVRGEALKQLLDGLKSMFGDSWANLADLSLFVLTKSTQKEKGPYSFLLEKMDDEVKRIDTWKKRKRLFQVQVPHEGVVCFDGKEEMLAMLPDEGQKIVDVNISAVFSGDVNCKLKEVYNSLFNEEFASFLPKPDEESLSSMLEVLKKIKGESITDDKYSAFWSDFGSHLNKIDALEVLKPLSQDAYDNAWKDFQRSKNNTIEGTVRDLEYKCDSLRTKIHADLLKKIEDIAEQEKNEIIQRYYSMTDVVDAESGNRKLQAFKDEKDSDLKERIIKAIKDDTELQQIISVDSVHYQVIFDSAFQVFSGKPLSRLLSDITTAKHQSEQMVELTIQSFIRQASIDERDKKLEALTKQVGADSETIEKLKEELKRSQQREKEWEEQLNKLHAASKQWGKQGSAQVISSVGDLLTSALKMMPDIIAEIKK